MGLNAPLLCVGDDYLTRMLTSYIELSYWKVGCWY